jgi:hypothetical protein
MSETPKSEVEKEIKFLEQMLADTDDEFWRERITVKLRQLREALGREAGG